MAYENEDGNAGEGDAEFYNFMQQEALKNQQNDQQEQPTQDDGGLPRLPDGSIDWSKVDENQSSAEDQRINRLVAMSGETGVGDIVKKILGNVGNGVNAVGKWAKDNKELASLLTSGVGSAMKQKNDRELLELKNRYQIDAEDRAKAYAKELWQRKNDSITGMAPVSGIIGSQMLDPHLAYLQSRKK